MRENIKAVVSCALGIVVVATFAAAAMHTAPPQARQQEADERWMAFATAQAATWEAQFQPRSTAATRSVPPRTTTGGVSVAAPPLGTTPASLATAATRAPDIPGSTPVVAQAGLAGVRPRGLDTSPTPSGSGSRPAPSAPAATPPAAGADNGASPFHPTARIAATLPVNLRSVPGTSAPILGVVPPGAPLAATGEQATIAGALWRQFRLADGLVGWILDALVEDREDGGRALPPTVSRAASHDATPPDRPTRCHA